MDKEKSKKEYTLKICESCLEKQIEIDTLIRKA